MDALLRTRARFLVRLRGQRLDGKSTATMREVEDMAYGLSIDQLRQLVADLGISNQHFKVRDSIIYTLGRWVFVD